MNARLIFHLIALLAVCAGSCAAETDCFRSVEEALARAGVRDPRGFRLDGRAEDIFGGRSWARVVDCAHPERPARMVRIGAEKMQGETALPVRESALAAKQGSQEIVVKAGANVRVLVADSMARLEMPGVAQASGAVGDRVRVRLVATGENGRERFVSGIVLGVGVVELEP